METKNRKQWTVKELAGAASVSPQYIRRLLGDGQGRLIGYKLARDWFIDDQEARRWLELRKVRV